MPGRGEFDPLKELASVQKRMNDLFESALAKTNFETSSEFDSWEPVCDAYETAEALVLCLELPGLEQERIDVRVDGDELVVEGEREISREPTGEHHLRMERSYGRFSRRFHLPSAVDRDAARATYRDGLLRIVVPKRDVLRDDPIRVAVD
jgi:HSP20 family protein